jgi:hypothetical protein
MTQGKDVSRISLRLRDRENTGPKKDAVSVVSSNARFAELLDSAGIAARLHVPDSWVRSRTRARTPRSERIPCVRLGRYVRFSWTEVESWLSARAERGQ